MLISKILFFFFNIFLGLVNWYTFNTIFSLVYHYASHPTDNMVPLLKKSWYWKPESETEKLVKPKDDIHFPLHYTESIMVCKIDVTLHAQGQSKNTNDTQHK